MAFYSGVVFPFGSFEDDISVLSTLFVVKLSAGRDRDSGFNSLK